MIRIRAVLYSPSNFDKFSNFWVIGLVPKVDCTLRLNFFRELSIFKTEFILYKNHCSGKLKSFNQYLNQRTAGAERRIGLFIFVSHLISGQNQWSKKNIKVFKSAIIQFIFLIYSYATYLIIYIPIQEYTDNHVYCLTWKSFWLHILHFFEKKRVG